MVDQGDDAGRKEALQLLERIPDTADVRLLQAQARVGDEAAEGAAAVTAKLDALLGRVKTDPAAHQEYLDLLEIMGPDDPRVATYRKALTARLF